MHLWMDKLMARPYIDLSCTNRILELMVFKDGRKEQGREVTVPRMRNQGSSPLTLLNRRKGDNEVNHHKANNKTATQICCGHCAVHSFVLCHVVTCSFLHNNAQLRLAVWINTSDSIGKILMYSCPLFLNVSSPLSWLWLHIFKLKPAWELDHSLTSLVCVHQHILMKDLFRI